MLQCAEPCHVAVQARHIAPRVQRFIPACCHFLCAGLPAAALQLSILPQLHAGQLVCVPALHVWPALLAPDNAWGGHPTGASTNGQTLLQVSTGDGRGAAADADFETADAAAAHEVTTPCSEQPLQLRLPAAVVHTCQLLLLHTAANWLSCVHSSEGAAALETEEASAAVHDVFNVISSIVGPRQYLSTVMHVWQGQAPQQIVSALVPGAQESLPAWQLQQLQQAVTGITAAPHGLRLQGAVVMAAAAAAASEDDAGQIVSEDSLRGSSSESSSRPATGMMDQGGRHLSDQEVGRFRSVFFMPWY